MLVVVEVAVGHHLEEEELEDLGVVVEPANPASLRVYLPKDLEGWGDMQVDLVVVIILFLEKSMVVLADLADLLAEMRG
jgi:hypothetical protein